VIDHSRPIAQVARELGVHEGTLGNWVNLYRNEHADEEPPLTPAERVQLAEAQRELRELRMENEFLKKAAAYFARDPREPSSTSSSTRAEPATQSTPTP
jgi:transposase-like protein